MDIGVPEEALRFRQHLPTEMAHYAIDCWDVEALTDAYGWIEIIGIADRTDYDLKSHAEHSGEDLRVFIEYDEPRKIRKRVVKAEMGRLGPRFRKDAARIVEALAEKDPEEIEEALMKEGKYLLELDREFEILPDDVTFQEVEETITGEKVYPM